MSSRERRDAEKQAGDPAVLSAELGDEAGADELPLTAFLPTEPVSVEDQEVRLELRYTTEGALALMTFTSLERLVASCGDQQPWIAVPGGELPMVAERAGAELVLEDFALPESERRIEEES